MTKDPRRQVRLLLVEDDRVDALAFERAVKRDSLPFDFVHAGSVDEAARLLQEGAFDIIVSDFALSDGTALDILSANPETPTIITTGAGDEETAVAAMKLGAADYLIKDTDLRYLKALPHRVYVTLSAQAAARAARESERQFEALANNTPALVWMAGPDGSPNYFNRTWLDFRGRSIAQEQGEGWMEGVHPADRAPRRETYRCALERREPFEANFRLRRADGTFRWLLERGVPRLGGSGEVLGFIGSCLDVTTSVEAAANLQASMAEAHRLAEEAKAAERAKSQFLATMSHEIRTPLNAVIGFSDILLEGDIDDQQRDFLRGIKSSGQQLLRLLNDVLEISKLEAGHLRLNREPVDLPDLVTDVVQLRSPEAEAKGITLDLRVEAAGADAVLSDEDRLRQVILNLLDNAVKFTSEGGVTVSLKAIRTPGGPAAVTVAVADTGCGVADEHRDRIFEPFGQAGGEIATQYGGAGLGLTICQTLARALGGRIEVASEEGAGSTFTLTFCADTAPGDR